MKTIIILLLFLFFAVETSTKNVSATGIPVKSFEFSHNSRNVTIISTKYGNLKLERKMSGLGEERRIKLRVTTLNWSWLEEKVVAVEVL